MKQYVAQDRVHLRGGELKQGFFNQLFFSHTIFSSLSGASFLGTPLVLVVVSTSSPFSGSFCSELCEDLQ